MIEAYRFFELPDIDESTVMKEQTLKALQGVFHLPREKVEKNLSRRFWTYYATIFQQTERLISIFEMRKHVFEMTESSGKTILDFGCGFGLDCKFYEALGAEKVVGLDVNQEHIQTFRKLIGLLDLPSDNIEPTLSDGGMLKFKNSSVDTVTLSSVVSHIPSEQFDGILEEAYRILRPGGFLFIADDNNKIQMPFCKEKRERKRQREVVENGPACESIKLGVEVPFKDLRRKMIGDRFPHLTTEQIDFFSARTQGMYGNEIYESVIEFEETSVITHNPSFRYRDPEDGQVMELQINPFGLKKLIQNIGFNARIVPRDFAFEIHEQDSLLKKIIKLAFIKTIGHPLVALHPLPLFFSHWFNILARKPSDYCERTA